MPCRITRNTIHSSHHMLESGRMQQPTGTGRWKSQSSISPSEVRDQEAHRKPAGMSLHWKPEWTESLETNVRGSWQQSVHPLRKTGALINECPSSFSSSLFHPGISLLVAATPLWCGSFLLTWSACINHPWTHPELCLNNLQRSPYFGRHITLNGQYHCYYVCAWTWF